MANTPRVTCDQCHAHEQEPPHVFQQEAFKAQVYDRASEVDPENEQDWFSLTVGWAVGRGMTPEQAHYFAIHIRYHTELG